MVLKEKASSGQTNNSNSQPLIFQWIGLKNLSGSWTPLAGILQNEFYFDKPLIPIIKFQCVVFANSLLSREQMDISFRDLVSQNITASGFLLLFQLAPEHSHWFSFLTFCCFYFISTVLTVCVKEHTFCSVSSALSKLPLITEHLFFGPSGDVSEQWGKTEASIPASAAILLY